MLLLPNDDGCQAIIAAGGAVPKTSDPPATGDNYWACADSGTDVICFNMTDPNKKGGADSALFQRNRAQPDSPPLGISMRKSTLSEVRRVFPVGTTTFESPRESLTLLPGDGTTRPYLLRIEVFFQLGDGRYGYMNKVCTGHAAPMPQELVGLFYKEMEKITGAAGKSPKAVRQPARR
jgi:hypothetical protein